MSISIGERWYVVKTKTGREFNGIEEIRSFGIEAFNPSYKKTILHARKRQEVIRPLYPLHIFAKFDRDKDGWAKIKRARSVSHILGTSPDGYIRPSPLPVGVVEHLIQVSEISGGFIQLAEDKVTVFPKNAPVVITDGPFTNHDALVDSDEGKRVKILLALLGQEVKTEIDRCALRLKSAASV